MGALIRMRHVRRGTWGWTDPQGGAYEAREVAWLVTRPFGMSLAQFEQQRGPDWYDPALPWHLWGPDGQHVKSFKSLTQVKQHLTNVAASMA